MGVIRLLAALAIIMVVSGCASEQLSTVQGEFTQLWSDGQGVPAGLTVPAK